MFAGYPAAGLPINRHPHIARVAPQGWKESHAEAPPAISAGASRPQTVPRAACSSSWARLLAKVYEISPLVCPRCGSEMKLIALITDPSQVRKILRHLLKIRRARQDCKPHHWLDFTALPLTFSGGSPHAPQRSQPAQAPSLPLR